MGRGVGVGITKTNGGDIVGRARADTGGRYVGIGIESNGNDIVDRFNFYQHQIIGMCLGIVPGMNHRITHNGLESSIRRSRSRSRSRR